MQTKSILAKTAVVISLCALCSSVFAAPTSKTLTKSEELYPQGWTVGDQIKFKKGTTASLNDNGAVISQNSWGYAVGTGRNTSSYINPVHKEAIDYFIKYAGCDNNGEQLDGSPMKGGIVLFASGNANTSDPRIAAPADYD